MSASPRVRLEPLSERGLDGGGPEWRALTARSSDSHYALTSEWLGAWARTYEPGPLALLRVGDVAIGLLELRRSGRWAFAGGPVTPQRRLLCARGGEDAAWRAVWGWLGQAGRRCAELEAFGLPGGVPVPQWTRLVGEPSYALGLPASFDEYLAARAPGTRKGLKGKLRRLEREGASVAAVDRADTPRALDRFLDLHARRAAAKGEQHPHVDARLARMLAALPEDGEVALRVFELRAGSSVAGISVRLDHGDTGYFYNAGIDPAHGDLSPGVALELASIHDAIDRGLRRFDLGPGEYRYKRDLGGLPAPRFRATVARRSLPGLALRVARTALAARRN